ncbi:MAG: hypothetical protein ACK4MF_02545 [Hyphomicrobiaceae bacterium]
MELVKSLSGLRGTLAGVVMASAVIATATPLLVTTAASAGLAGDGYASLEERIAALEPTMARGAGRTLALTIAGQINSAVMVWDDGGERDAYVVGNKNDQSNISFTGDARISQDLQAGYTVTIRLRDNLSDGVDQSSDDGGLGFVVWESYWFMASERYGRLAVGQSSRVSDTAPEIDLSQTAVPGHVGSQDMGGHLALRLRTGDLAGVKLGDVYDHFNGDTANVVRYDAPAVGGFIVSASYGEDDIWDVGGKYSAEFSGFRLGAAVAYSHATDPSGLDGSGDVAHKTWVGSASIVHELSGLNAVLAAGNRHYDKPVDDQGLGILRKPADSSFVYAKLGWLAELGSLGPTAFYGEWGQFRDFISATEDFSPADVGSGAARFTGNTAEFWGVGVVQHIEAAAMQIYLGFRHHDFGFDLVDGVGNAVASPGVESLRLVVLGTKISF